MKKQLVILLAAISLLALAQSPQRFPGGVIGKYFQKSGSSADSVLLGNGEAKAVKDLQMSSGGGAGANVYLSNTDNQIAGYKTSQPTIDAAEVTKTITASTPNVTAWGEKYLYTLPISTTIIPSGLWTLHLYGFVDSPVGISKVVFRIFKYSSGIETTLYTFNSFEVDDITKADILTAGSGTEITLLATDYIGVQVGFTTTSTSSRTLTYSIGNGNASYSTNPLPLRHSSLRDKNGEPDFQHLTTTQVAAVNNIVGIVPENSANKGMANGYAPLDANSKVSTTYLPAAILGALKYQGTWAASVGSFPSSPAQGNYWVISTAGTLGAITYKVGDWMTYNGTGWDKIDNQQTVSSVFGRVGAVVATSGDYTTDQVTEGTNKYYTDTRARSAFSLTTTGDSGVSTYNGSTGAWNIPNYTLAGLGGISSATLSTSTAGITTTSSTSGGVSSLTVNAASGYAIPTTTQLNNAATAYGWGNHAAAGYALATGANASGTWGINITGNAATATTATNWAGSSSFGSYAYRSSGLAELSGANFAGNVGIGTTNPLWKLQIEGTGTQRVGIVSTDNNTAGIYAQVLNGGAQVGIFTLRVDNYGSTNLFTGTSGESIVQTWMANGNVGINTTSPSEKLNVVGNIKASGSITASSATITGGSPSAGKVLTATDANGNSTWQTPGYSSGTYVPTYSNVSTSITAISTNNSGLYYKIGNIAHVNLQVIISCGVGNGHQFTFSLPYGVSSSYNGLLTGTAFIDAGNIVPASVIAGTNTGQITFSTQNVFSNTVINLTFDYFTSN